MAVFKKVWVISELYYPEETSTGTFLTQTAEGLANQFHVKVLCGQPTYGSRGQRAPVNEVRNSVKIHRCWSTTFNKDVMPLRLFNMLTITLSIMLNAVFRIACEDCILVVTNPPLLPFAVLLTCFVRRAKCVLIVHDVYPDVLVATGTLSKNSLPAKTIAWVSRILYRHMDRIVVLGRDMETLIRSRVPEHRERIICIPHWADLDLVKPLPRSENKFLKDLGLSDTFVIQYSGNIGRTHGIEHLVQCAEVLNDGSLVHFLFIGFGGKKAWIKQVIEDRRLTNVFLLDYQPRSELLYSLNACDIAIVSLIKGMTGISVPSRIYNVMAAGKPIIGIADESSELAQVIREEEIGWVVEPGNVPALKMAIIDAQENPEKLKEMGFRARMAVETRYSFDQAQVKYRELVRSVCKSAP